MPKPIRKKTAQQLEEDRIGDAIDDFDDGFCRAANGNLIRRWGDATLTVYRRNGRFYWSARDDDGPRFSDRGYATKDDALYDLRLEVLGI